MGESSIVEKLGIPIVLESELHVAYKPVTISLSLSDPDVASMWQTLKSCGSVATLGEDGRITFWRQMPKPSYVAGLKFRAKDGERWRSGKGG